MNVVGKEEIYTIEDIYALPGGERAELIDGRIYYMAPPNTKHQRLVHFFDREIGSYIQSREGECEVFPAPFAVFLNKTKRIMWSLTYPLSVTHQTWILGVNMTRVVH